MLRRPIFDLIRRLLGRGLRQREVAQIDRAIDAALDAAQGADFLSLDRVTPGPCPTSIGPDGIALIKRFEGCARRAADGFEAYPDPATGGAPWTIGWGATGPGIGPGTVWTQAQCDARLEADLARYAADVSEALGGAPTTQAQFDALVSFHYNTGAIRRAALTRKHISGDHVGAAAEFARWKHAGGRVLKGLVRRRAAEAALYRNSKQSPDAAEPAPSPAVPVAIRR
jgi:GH24 family phage-related lysozyme (muramidase)